MWFAYVYNADLAILFAAIYLVAAYFCRRDVWVCMLASFASQIYYASPLYAYTVDNAAGFAFIVYAAIYFTAVKSLKNYQVMKACFTMGAFELAMCGAYYDWFSPQGVNDWLYQNYELLVALLHAYIVCTLVRWRFVGHTARLFRDSLLRNFGHNGLSLYF